MNEPSQPDQIDQLFAYDKDTEKSGMVRVRGTSQEPLFVAVDVCRLLGITNPRDAVAAFPEDEKGVVSNYTLGGDQEMLVVKESGLYRLIFRSRKPQAERFRAWVFKDVLPAIRNIGVRNKLTADT